jgi:hypothetical protein
MVSCDPSQNSTDSKQPGSRGSHPPSCAHPVLLAPAFRCSVPRLGGGKTGPKRACHLGLGGPRVFSAPPRGQTSGVAGRRMQLRSEGRQA